MYKNWRRFLVPEKDAEQVLIRRVVQGNEACEKLKEYGFGPGHIVVQAGGNWGYWPRRLADTFSLVYTFEPDHACFTCLTANTSNYPNVVRFQAALGSDRGCVNITQDEDTTGNGRVDGAGHYPTLRIDDLALGGCDLIYLDVEGRELAAIYGALETVRDFRPWIIFEACKAYDPAHETEEFLRELDYITVGQIGTRDTVMRPL